MALTWPWWHHISLFLEVIVSNELSECTNTNMKQNKLKRKLIHQDF